jgi:hypothetical protein
VADLAQILECALNVGEGGLGEMDAKEPQTWRLLSRPTLAYM